MANKLRAENVRVYFRGKIYTVVTTDVIKIAQKSFKCKFAPFSNQTRKHADPFQPLASEIFSA